MMDFEIEAKGNSNYQKLSYKKEGKVGDLAERIDVIIKWMESYKLNAGVSRYTRYKGYIEDCSIHSARMQSDVDKIMLHDEYQEIFNKSRESIKELRQIFEIYKWFKEETSHGFWERMKKIVSGKDFYDGESDDPARNYLYEILVAAWYRAKSYEIDFDSQTLTDVVGRRNGNTIYIECKRLKSSKKYEENYRKACKQLNKVEDKGAIKLVYIDIYNCISKSLNDFEYANSILLDKSVNRKMIEEFVKPNLHYTNKILNEFKDSVDGVVFSIFGTFGINNIATGIETEIVHKENVKLYEDISDERFEYINSMIRFL